VELQEQFVAGLLAEATLAVEKDTFPYCKLQRARIDSIRDQWQNIGSPEDIMAKFLNLHSWDQHYWQTCTYRLWKKYLISSSLETVCRLHAKLMQTSRVLYSDTCSGFRLSYLNIRQASRLNVTATLLEQGVKIQFCPSDEVAAELNTFCKRFNELIQQVDMDPFASAARISHVLLTIHPFEDGNGRLSRILASIPLLKNGLPPLCIPAFYKPAYNLLLNKAISTCPIFRL